MIAKGLVSLLSGALLLASSHAPAPVSASYIPLQEIKPPRCINIEELGIVRGYSQIIIGNIIQKKDAYVIISDGLVIVDVTNAPFPIYIGQILPVVYEECVRINTKNDAFNK